MDRERSNKKSNSRAILFSELFYSMHEGIQTYVHLQETNQVIYKLTRDERFYCSIYTLLPCHSARLNALYETLFNKSTLTFQGLTAEYPSTPKEILKSVATRLRGYAVTA